MEPNPYEAPKEVGYDPPGTVAREPEGWIGVILWIVTLSLGALVLAGLLSPSLP